MPFEVTPKEVEYQVTQTLLGNSYKVFLSNSSTLTIDSTTAQWTATELSATNGYAAVTGTVSATGTYNSTLKSFETAQINAVFTATTGPINFRAIIIQLSTTGGGARNYPYAVNIFPTQQTIAAGTSLPFGIQLASQGLPSII